MKMRSMQIYEISRIRSSKVEAMEYILKCLAETLYSYMGALVLRSVQAL